VQREGLGTAMYVYALDIMRAQGMIAASVGTGGDPSHAPARCAYKKAGFARAVQSVYLYRTL
jgi:GNAT superfamily N-acetyltransferase